MPFLIFILAHPYLIIAYAVLIFFGFVGAGDYIVRGTPPGIPIAYPIFQVSSILLLFGLTLHLLEWLRGLYVQMRVEYYGGFEQVSLPEVIQIDEMLSANAQLITRVFGQARKEDIARVHQQIQQKETSIAEWRRSSISSSNTITELIARTQNEVLALQQNVQAIEAFYVDVTPRAIATLDLSLPPDEYGPFRTTRANSFRLMTSVVQNFAANYICSDTAIATGALVSLREKYTGNQHAISTRLSPKDELEWVYVTTHPAMPERAIREFLTGFPPQLVELFVGEAPYALPPVARYNGMHIVAPPQRGKTQALQSMIVSDLELVKRNAGSIVVMNSDMDLIRNILALKIFAPGEALAGKLIFIEPSATYPLALNLFAMGKERINAYEKDEQVAAINATVEMFRYVLDTLMDSPLTTMQQTLFNFTVRACMEIPGANIVTFKDLLVSDKGYWRRYAQYFSPRVLEFFERSFDDAQFVPRRGELGWRLFNLMSNSAFADMLEAKECKLDLFTQLQSSKVVVIHTNKRLLEEKQCELFGRFFIAMILRAAQERTIVDRSERVPTFVYIDECHDYIKDDTKLPQLIEQCRKQNVGVILAHQRLTQLSVATLASISNVAIKLANADDEAEVLAKRLRADRPEDVKLPVGQFAAFIRDYTTKPIVLKVQPFVMENMPKASDAEQEALKVDMRKRFSTYIESEATAATDTTPETIEEPPDPYGTPDELAPSPPDPTPRSRLGQPRPDEIDPDNIPLGPRTKK